MVCCGGCSEGAGAPCVAVGNDSLLGKAAAAVGIVALRSQSKSRERRTPQSG